MLSTRARQTRRVTEGRRPSPNQRVIPVWEKQTRATAWGVARVGSLDAAQTGYGRSNVSRSAISAPSRGAELITQDTVEIEVLTARMLIPWSASA